jgi:hypothetical protein
VSALMLLDELGATHPNRYFAFLTDFFPRASISDVTELYTLMCEHDGGGGGAYPLSYMFLNPFSAELTDGVWIGLRFC